MESIEGDTSGRGESAIVARYLQQKLNKSIPADAPDLRPPTAISARAAVLKRLEAKFVESGGKLPPGIQHSLIWINPLGNCYFFNRLRSAYSRPWFQMEPALANPFVDSFPTHTTMPFMTTSLSCFRAFPI